VKPQRRCKICRQKFTPAFDNVRWCCPEHGAQFALVELEKKRVKQRKAMVKKERDAWRKRKEAVKPLKHWIDLTQRAVNDVCRETALANGEGCISCGAKTANAWHAGHYRTTAAAGHLRFTRININLQCDACNLHKSGNIEAYRISLVARCGEAAIQELENNNTPHRWTREELKEIRLTALAELRARKKREAA
jgi:hypothetical protein